jgi:hypothetical protein
MTELVVAVLLGALIFPQAGQAAPNAPPTRTGVIRGRILRADGRPIPRAQVRLVPVAGPAPAFDGRRPVDADVDGRYEFAELMAGTYRLTASKAGYVTVEFGQRRAFERGETITLADAETREKVDIVLPRHGAIMGRVVDEAGDAVEGASVRVFQVQFAQGRRQLTDVPGAAAQRTNDLGRYRIYGLQPGRYVVCAIVGQIVFPGQPMIELPGYAATYFPGTPTPSEAQMVTVKLSEDVGNVDFSLVPVRTARIAGTVLDSTGEASASGSLVLSPSRRSGSVATTPVGARIDPDGTFEFRNVAPGEYVVQAYKGKRNASTDGEFASQFVAVNGADVTGLVVQTSTGSFINGRVTLDGTGSIRPRDVELAPMPVDLDLAPLTGGAPPRAEIYNDWTFEVSGISGPRLLRLTRAPPGWALKATLLRGSDITDTPVLFGSKEQSLKDVEVVLTDQTAGVSGTVTDGSERPVIECLVVVFAVESGRWHQESRFVKSSRPGQDGTFSVRGLPPDEYYVAAIDRVQGNDWQDPAFLEALARRAVRVTLAEAQSLSISLKLLAPEK